MELALKWLTHVEGHWIQESGHWGELRTPVQAGGEPAAE